MSRVFDTTDRDRAALYAPHGRPGAFFCPWARFPVRHRELLRWKLLDRNAYRGEPRCAARVLVNDGRSIARAVDGAALTSVGHSTFVYQDGDDVLLTDPHWGPRALVPRRLAPPGVPLAAIPSHAFALLSHNHYDHLDSGTVRHLPVGVDWYVPLGLGDWVRRRARGNVVEMDWWQSVERGRFTLTCLPAQHWSNRIDQPRFSSLWCGWMIATGERRVYFAGDTGYFAGFAEFGRRFAPIDLAILPIGAYEPRWFMRHQHMNPEEALRAFRDLGARRMAGMHWGVFDLTDEPPDQAPRDLERVLAAEGKRLTAESIHVLAVGETLDLGRA